MKKLTFADFLSKFPPVVMPVTLGEDTHHTFGTENNPLSDELIAQYIRPTEAFEPDEEFTEYVPCFAIDDTKQFIAVVWWKAELLNYEYVLATFDGKGELIDRQVIAQTKVEGDKVYRAVATISVDLELVIAEGLSGDAADHFDPETMRTRYLEIQASGHIVEG